MRVAVLVEQLFAPVPGGTGRFARELTKELAAQRPGDSALVMWSAWHRAGSDIGLDGLGRPRRLSLGPKVLARAWERGIGPAPRHADAVLAPTLLVPPRRGRPLVVAIHDVVPWTHPATLTPRGVAFHRRMAHRAAQEADAIVVPTNAVAAGLGEHLSIPPERLHIVGEGATSAVVQLPADAAERRRTLGLPPAYLLTVSTLEPRKGLDVVLDALALRAGLPLAVVGQPGWGGVDLGAATRSRGLAPDRVLALGRVSDADLAAILAGATGLVAPSRAEGFGLPVLEAMAAGIPVVSSDDPALVEVGGGATAVVPVGEPAPLADALQRLEGDPGWRGELVARGLQRAEHYSWSATAALVWQVLDEVVSAAGSKGRSATSG